MFNPIAISIPIEDWFIHIAFSIAHFHFQMKWFRRKINRNEMKMHAAHSFYIIINHTNIFSSSLLLVGFIFWCVRYFVSMMTRKSKLLCIEENLNSCKIKSYVFFYGFYLVMAEWNSHREKYIIRQSNTHWTLSFALSLSRSFTLSISFSLWLVCRRHSVAVKILFDRHTTKSDFNSATIYSIFFFFLLSRLH